MIPVSIPVYCSSYDFVDFIRLDIATNNVTSSIICRLAHIARQHIEKSEAKAASAQTPRGDTRHVVEETATTTADRSVLGKDRPIPSIESLLKEPVEVDEHPGDIAASPGISGGNSTVQVPIARELEMYVPMGANFIAQGPNASQEDGFWAQDFASLIYPIDESFFNSPEARFFHSGAMDEVSRSQRVNPANTVSLQSSTLFKPSSWLCMILLTETRFPPLFRNQRIGSLSTSSVTSSSVHHNAVDGPKTAITAQMKSQKPDKGAVQNQVPCDSQISVAGSENWSAKDERGDIEAETKWILVERDERV